MIKNLIATLLTIVMLAAPLYAQKKSGGSSFSTPRTSSSWSSKPSAPKPSSPSTPSSGSKPSSSWSPPKPSAPSPTIGSSLSRSNTTSRWSSSTTNTSKPSAKPAPPSYDSLARAEALKAESRKNYEASKAPAPTFKLPSGKAQPLNPSDKQVDRIRRETTQEKWESRQSRTTDFYRNAPPVARPVTYEDRYHPSLNHWLAAQSDAVLFDFYWHHAAQMDEQRIKDLRKAIGQERSDRLSFQVNNRLVRGEGIQPDYLPPGVESDVLYSDEYVDAAINPTARHQDNVEYEINWGKFWDGVWWLIRWTFYIVAGTFVLWLLYATVFVFRYPI